jgi:hypothetical protein
MSDDVTPERVAVMSTAARVPLNPDSCARVARAVTPAVTRFAAMNVAIAFEIEPSSFTVMARAGIGR